MLSLKDAGISFNLPLPPLLIRAAEESAIKRKLNVNVIIVLDASGDLLDETRIGDELCKAALWAKQHNLPFPASPHEICVSFNNYS